MNFELNLSMVLAHTLVFESNPHGVELYCGGDPAAPTVNESMSSIIAAMTEGLPGLQRVTNAEILPSEQAKLSASQAISPEYLKLQDQMYKTYGPSLSKTGSDIAAQQAEAQAKSDLGVISGTGRQLVNQALETAKAGDPEYYKNREEISKGISSLLSDLNPNSLSGGEEEAVRRAVNAENAARGTVNNPSATATTANAMKFGNALTDKKAKVANILGTTSSALPSLKSGMDVFNVATGRSSGSNAGDNKYMNPSTNMGTSAETAAGNLLASGTSLANASTQANSQRRDSLDRVMQGIQGISSIWN